MNNIEFIIFIIVFVYSIVICCYNFFNKSEFIYFVSDNKDAIDKITDIVNSNIDTTSNSKHMWNEDINNNVQTEIFKINDEILYHLGDEFQYIPSMTELYYSSKGNQNSDRQYVDSHMDGPFYSCILYRALVIVNGNKNIDTYFPDINEKINLKKYDIVLFDYNNELHYIDVNNDVVDNSQRTIIKLHYVKSSNKLCEKYHCEFGRQTRDLFELNKKNLYSSGMIARASLYYNTNRKYIVFVIFLLLLLYYNKRKNKLLHNIIRYILYTYLGIELAGIIYTLHFHFLKRKVCE